MDAPAQFLILLGGLLLIGMVTHIVGRRTALPRVTLLMVFGILVGLQGSTCFPILARTGGQPSPTWCRQWWDSSLARG